MISLLFLTIYGESTILFFYTGPQPTYLLHIYDQSRQTIKDRVSVEDIVTLRAGKNVSFHIYLNSGKFILFKAESLDSQSSWMAEIKMALGKGMILSIARLPRDRIKSVFNNNLHS